MNVRPEVLRRRDVAKFAAALVVSLPISLAMYALCIPYYERALVAGIGSSSVDLADGEVVVSRPSSGGVVVHDRYDPHIVLLNLAIVPALILAFPVRGQERLRAVLLAVPVLLVLDVALLALVLRTRWALGDGHAPILPVAAWGVLMTSGQTTGVLVSAFVAGRILLGRSIAAGLSKQGRPCSRTL